MENETCFTDEELLDFHYNAALDSVRHFLANKTKVPDFTDMPPEYQLRVIKSHIDSAIEMRKEAIIENVKDHLKKEKENETI